MSGSTQRLVDHRLLRPVEADESSGSSIGRASRATSNSCLRAPARRRLLPTWRRTTRSIRSVLLGTLLLAFVVLPTSLAALAPVGYRELLREMRPALVLA